MIKTIILEVIYDEDNIVRESNLAENKESKFSMNEDLQDNNYQTRTRFNFFKEIFDNMRRRNN